MESGKLGYGVRVNCIYPGLVPTEMGIKLAVDLTAVGLFADVDAAVGAVVARPRSAGWARSPRWPTRWSSWLRTRPGSSPASGLPVDGGMGM